MDPLAQAKQVFEIEIAALRAAESRLDGAIIDATTLIKAAVDAGRKVIGIGIGKSEAVCRKIVATMTSTGTTAVMLDGVNALHGDLGIVSDGDVILALSQSGETPEMMSLLPHLKRKMVKIIAITGDVNSTLAKHSDVTISSQVEREACPLSLAPTASTTVMMVLGDALAMALMEAHGFTRLDFARVHPGGSLGEHLLRTARDLMRPLDRTVFVKLGAEVCAVIDQLVARKAGAAIVVDDVGTLRGIFTHGDFARAFHHHAYDLRGVIVDTLMSPNPVCVYEDQFATEVAEVLKNHQIDELIVLQRDKRIPLGVVDSQDLARFKLI